ncbi:putative nucleotidyltransferase [Opitutaceae bacterium TAV1]|nr:putative nucleotidyltransferase [Opitutaceae bacterium TAV1]
MGPVWPKFPRAVGTLIIVAKGESSSSSATNQMTFTSPRVSAGTQVVVHQEVRGSNGVAVHPRGAVGIVARTPAGTEVNYLIRFADGFETSLERSRFEVLKHFKDRLPASDALGNFQLEDCVIYRCTVGSRAYGLDTETSDTDLRGIYQAPPEMQWSLFGAPDQFEDNEAQTCYWELQKFLVMALRANPNMLECLYSPLVDKTSVIGDRLLSIRECFLSRMIFQTFNGYALSQFKKLEQDLRNQGEIRWKHAMHLLRLLLTGAATLRERRMPVRVENHRDRLLAVRHGEVSWGDINVWRGELHRDFEAALHQTRLPERPDYEKVNAFLVEARRSQIHPVVSQP